MAIIDLRNPEGKYGGSAKAVANILQTMGQYANQKADLKRKELFLGHIQSGQNLQDAMASTIADETGGKLYGSGFGGAMAKLFGNFAPRENPLLDRIAAISASVTPLNAYQQGMQQLESQKAQVEIGQKLAAIRLANAQANRANRPEQPRGGGRPSDWASSLEGLPPESQALARRIRAFGTSPDKVLDSISVIRDQLKDDSDNEELKKQLGDAVSFYDMMMGGEAGTPKPEPDIAETRADANARFGSPSDRILPLPGGRMNPARQGAPLIGMDRDVLQRFRPQGSPQTPPPAMTRGSEQIEGPQMPNGLRGGPQGGPQVNTARPEEQMESIIEEALQIGANDADIARLREIFASGDSSAIQKAISRIRGK